MTNERLFLLVDDDSPADQAARLQQSFKLAGLTGRVTFASSPAEMLQKVREEIPALILLDHHWPEVSIDKVLQGLLREAPRTRVVLYTGKTIDPSTILECARNGVAEYLMKGAAVGDALAKKLSILADDPENTLKKLGTPSGTFQQVIQELEKAVAELASERSLRQNLEREVAGLRDPDRRRLVDQIVRFLSVIVYVVVLACLVVYIAIRIPDNWTVLVIFVIAALAGVFLLDRSISQLIFKGEGWHLLMRRASTKDRQS